MGVPFALAMIKTGICANQPTSELVDKMIGNFTLALPCILNGNKDCLMYDIYFEGAINMWKMAQLSAGIAAAVKNFNEMADLCEVAYYDVMLADTPMKVTDRTCLLLKQLIATIKKNGVDNCPLVPNVLKALNLLTILKPKNSKQILSADNNLKNVLKFKNLLM